MSVSHCSVRFVWHWCRYGVGKSRVHFFKMFCFFDCFKVQILFYFGLLHVDVILMYNIQLFVMHFDSCNTLQELILTENSLEVKYLIVFLSLTVMLIQLLVTMQMRPHCPVLLRLYNISWQFYTVQMSVSLAVSIDAVDETFTEFTNRWGKCQC